MFLYPKTFFILLIIIAPLFVFSQKGVRSPPLSYNNCGVVASFTPDNDSVITGFFNVTFTSTSTGATNLTWFINGLPGATGNNFNFGSNNPGLYEIKLVASNGSCTDTALCYYFLPGTQTGDRKNFRAYYSLSPAGDQARNLLAVSSGGYIMSGNSTVRTSDLYNNTFQYGSLVLINDTGCVEWSKIIHNGYQGTVTNVIQTTDNNFAILGNLETGHYVIKTDQQGNFLWAKDYTFNNSFLYIQYIKQTDDNGFVMAAPVYTNQGFIMGMVIIRADALGNIVWSKFYNKNALSYTYFELNDMLQKGNDLYFAGIVDQTENTSSTIQHYTGILMKMNYANGATEWVKNYSQNDTTLFPSDLHWYGDRLLLNNNVAKSNQINADNDFIILDTAGNILQNYIVSNPGGGVNSFFSAIYPQNNGDLYMSNIGQGSVFIKMDSFYNIKYEKQFNTFTLNATSLQYTAVGKDKSFAGVGTAVADAMAVYTGFSNKYMFQRIDSLGGWNAQLGLCGYDSLEYVVSQTPAVVNNFNWDVDSLYSNIQATSAVYTLISPYAQTRFVCPSEFFDSCSFLKVTGNASVCNLSNSYTYKIHRNAACNETVQWNFSDNIVVISQTDSQAIVKFPSFGNYTIAALFPYACSPVKDSIIITAASKTPPLNLGPDTSLCAGNSLLLHAGNQFLNYVWSDGSIDSTLLIKSAGQYWVHVTDSCGNLIGDSINVSPAPNVPLFVGPDRIKCNNDTLHLNAPPGFINYSWSPTYNISSTTSQNVIIDPFTDTSYSLMAEKTPGCYGFDTIKITVYHSAPIHLGNDTSFCSGDSLVLNAGNNFVSYVWSTGSTSESITVKSKGYYSVTTKDANHCSSSDTLQVVQLYNNPIVDLGRDSILCVGTTRIIDAGNKFKKYVWQDGSTSETISVSSTGLYWVAVTDYNGCVGSDTLNVSTLVPLPSTFLPGDTSICGYASLLIAPVRQFSSYLWSTGDVSPSITVKSAGQYLLTVTDQFGCKGTDSIQVQTHYCLGGAYFPDAFTPNNDGHNDVFKPVMLGNVVKFHFIIYNRYGQLVFESSNPDKGWDGVFSGTMQDAGTYVWSCSYQFDGDVARTSKGYVILIR